MGPFVAIWVMWMGILQSTHSLSAPRINVSKLKTDMSKMKNQITRHSSKEQMVASKEALLPKFGGKGANDNREDNGYEYFELLVRRSGTGPWLRYQDLLGDERTERIVNNVVNGGMENEMWREELDDFIRKNVFGTSIGGEGLAITKVKGVLPQFKKLKPRDFQFGYRIAVDDEPAYSIERGTSSTKESATISKTHTQADRIDVVKIVESANANNEHDRTTVSTSEESLLTLLRTLEAGMVTAGADSYVLFSDGSATIFEGNGVAGTTPQSADLSMVAINTPTMFSTASCGVYILPMRGSEPLYDISACVRVNGVAGMLDSPFDAEMIAGLSAVTVCRLIHPVGPRNIVHTDSKTLTRAVRTGPQGDLAERASPSRLAVWRLLDAHTKQLTGRGRPVECLWTPGHPERRDANKGRWTYRDVGIWIADEVAKDGDSSIVVLSDLNEPTSAGSKKESKKKGMSKAPSTKQGGEEGGAVCGGVGTGVGAGVGAGAKEPKKKITAAVAAAREEAAAVEVSVGGEGGEATGSVESSAMGNSVTAVDNPSAREQEEEEGEEESEVSEGSELQPSPQDEEEGAAAVAVAPIVIPVCSISGVDLVRISSALLHTP